MKLNMSLCPTFTPAMEPSRYTQELACEHCEHTANTPPCAVSGPEKVSVPPSRRIIRSAPIQHRPNDAYSPKPPINSSTLTISFIGPPSTIFHSTKLSLALSAHTLASPTIPCPAYTYANLS